MAMLLYNTGIIEEVKPKNLVFSEEEIIDLFVEYSKLRSARVLEMANVWCVWGEAEKEDEVEYNRIASEVNEEHVYSSALFIHDTEINPDWNLTDKIILKDYKVFFENIKVYLDKIAEEILSAADPSGNKAEEMILTTLGYNDDKKILFGFDPLNQPKNFYNNISFFNFANQINEYLNKNSKNLKKPFVIYSDKKMIIEVEDSKVYNLLDEMINLFKSKENYEVCSALTNVKNNWKNIIEKEVKPVKKRTKKPIDKKSSTDNTTNKED
jgi:hypothetical protein